MSIKRVRKIQFWLLFVLVCIFLDFILGGGRTLIHQSRLKTKTQVVVRSHWYDHDLRPNLNQGSNWYGPYHMTTNSLGFRDKTPRRVPLLPSSHRILLFGDSFTEGLGVDYEKTFANLIAEQTHSEVLNAGVRTYSPIIYYRKLKYLLEKGLRFHEVIVFLDISDIYDETERRLDDKGRVVIEEKNKSSFERVKFYSLSTFTYYYLKEKLAVRKFDKIPATEMSVEAFSHKSRWTERKWAFKKVGAPGLELSKARMNKLVRLGRDYNAKVTLVVYPWPYQIKHQDHDCIQVSYWKKWAKDRGVQFIDLFPGFIDNKPWKEIVSKYFIPRDVHWNEAGHRRVASLFLQHYRKSSLLEPKMIRSLP